MTRNDLDQLIRHSVINLYMPILLDPISDFVIKEEYVKT